jgi:hypothetical protein
MSEQQDLVTAIKTIAVRYLPGVVKRKDDAGIQKWGLRLADYATRLAVLAGAPLDDDEASTLSAAVAPPAVVPNYGDSRAMSSGLYNDWVVEWIKAKFPEAYVNWPPEVRAIAPDAIANAAKADGCLAQVCAAGVLGYPGGAWADMGDWSLYTAVTSTDGTHQVWHMGQLVGTQVGGDGLEFAHSLGFNW